MNTVYSPLATAQLLLGADDRVADTILLVSAVKQTEPYTKRQLRRSGRGVELRPGEHPGSRTGTNELA